MKARPSIALRLAFGLSLSTAILWLGAAIISGLVMRHELQGAFDETLEQSALRLLPLAIHDMREPDEASEHQIHDLDERERYFTWYVFDKTGRVIMRAADAQPTAMISPIANGFSNASGKRLYTVTDDTKGLGIVVIENTSHRSEALNASLAALLLPLSALLPVIFVAIWQLIRLAMRPLERLRHEIASRNSRNLAPLTADDQPRELAPIAKAVADLLVRLKSALDAERTFAASSAHELRTPIAGALAQTQQLALELGAAPQAGRVKDIEKSLKNLARLAETLLQISRIDAGFARSESTNDLLRVLQLTIRDLQSAPGFENRIDLVIAPEASLLCPMDVDAFAIVLRNILQNALIHGDDKGRISVTVEKNGSIIVRNDANLVQPAILASLGQPFVRGKTRASGSGLGLSISRMIMEQSGGSIALKSPATGKTDGFEVCLTLPV